MTKARYQEIKKALQSGNHIVKYFRLIPGSGNFDTDYIDDIDFYPRDNSAEVQVSSGNLQEVGEGDYFTIIKA